MLFLFKKWYEFWRENIQIKMTDEAKLLNFERYDSYLSITELIKNTTELADFLENPSKTLMVDSIRPIITYFVESEELMETLNQELQLQLARCFIYSFKFSIPEIPIEKSREKFMYRIFHLLNHVFSSLKDPESSDYNEKSNFFHLPTKSA